MINHLLITFLISIGLNLAMFIPAYIWKTDKLTDISYAVSFAFLAWYSLLSTSLTIVTMLGAIMVTLWATRLGTYLLVRINNIKKDKRFDGMRENFWQFLRFWFLQGLTVAVVMIPTNIMMFNVPFSFSTLHLVGITIWLVGLIIETIADWQKYTFISDAKNSGQWIASGIWKYSRHPNYFGEIALWFGIYLYALPSLTSAQAIFALISPLFITGMIIFISGIPLLEKSADKRWGNNPLYIRYKQETSVLIPWKKRRLSMVK